MSTTNDYAAWLASPKEGVPVERRLFALWLRNGKQFWLDDAWERLTVRQLVEFAHLQGVMDGFGFMEVGFIPESVGVPPPPGQAAITAAMVARWQKELSEAAREF